MSGRLSSVRVVVMVPAPPGEPSEARDRQWLSIAQTAAMEIEQKINDVAVIRIAESRTKGAICTAAANS